MNNGWERQRNKKSEIGVPSESWRGNAEYGTCFTELPHERETTDNWMGELYTPSLTKEVGQALAFRRQREMFGER